MSARPPRSRAGGFSLLELLVVVVILALLAGVATMAAGEGGEQALELAEVQVRDAVERARALSRSTRTAHGVVFDLATDRFAVVAEDGNAVVDPLTKRPYVVDFVRPGQPQLIDITVADFGAAGTTALFDAHGVPLTGGSVTIQRGGASRVLSFDAATGDLAGG